MKPLLFLMIALSRATAFADPSPMNLEGHIQVPTTEDASEAILHIDYSVSCADGVLFPGITGTLAYQGRKLRFDLFDMIHLTEVQLGTTSRTLTQIGEYQLDPTPGCTLLRFNPTVNVVPLKTLAPMDALVLKHSPALVIRDDQYEDRLTDLPLVMAYSLEPRGKNTAIKYTLFFTDEDSETKGKDTETHMARYGRRTDIEWVYEIELTPKDEVIAESYQGFTPNNLKNDFKHFSLQSTKKATQNGVGTPDITHSTSVFKGQYLPHSAHPLLYNIANNNVFSPFPNSKNQETQTVAYHLVPKTRVDSPDAREVVMLEHPWTFKVSDDEMIREDKLYGGDLGLSDQYLYALIDGDLKLSSPLNLIKGFRANIHIDNQTYTSGFGLSDIDRLGEDMWGHEAYTGIPVGRDRLKQIGVEKNETFIHGTFDLNADNLLHASTNAPLMSIKLNVKNLRFFKLVKRGKSYQTIDVSKSFDCKYGKLKDVSCTF